MIHAEMIMLAIRAGIKLGGVARQAYVASTRQGELMLPLPESFYQPDLATAENFFSKGHGGSQYLVEGSRLADLYHRAFVLDDQNNKLTFQEEAELVEICREYLARNNTFGGQGGNVHLADGATIDLESWNALLTVRQFDRGEVELQNRRLLHALLGTIVEVGVDYFATIPGALNTNSRYSKVLKAFIEALDQIPFADLDYERDWLNDLGGRFLVAALETVSFHPELITNDPNIERLVQVTSLALTDDVRKRLVKIKNNMAKKNNLKNWAELIFSSILSSAGREVINTPGRYLGIDEADETVLIKKVGNAFLDLAVEVDDLTLYRAFGKEGLDTMTRAVLKAVAEYPTLVGAGDQNPMSALVTDLAKTLANVENRFNSEMLPQLVRLIFVKSGAHLDLIWKAYIDDPTEPRNHLMLTAAKKIISILTENTPGQKWEPKFNKTDLLSITETVLDELANNPNWLLMEAADIDDLMEAALKSTLDAFKDRGDERLSSTVAAEMLKAAFKAAAMRMELTQKIEGLEKTLVAAAADAILSVIFDKNLTDKKAKWQLFRSESLISLFNISFLTLVKKTNLEKPAIEMLQKALKDKVKKFAAGEPVDLERFEEELEHALLT
jgi:hypothetical protein